MCNSYNCVSLSFARENHNVKQILESLHTLLKWKQIIFKDIISL